MFTNVTIAMKNVAKEASVMLLVANLENISTCDFHTHLCWGGNESLIVQALHCFGTLLNGLRNTLKFERKNFPAVLSNPNVLPVVFQSVTHWHHLEVHHSFLLPRQKWPLAQKSDIIVYIQFYLF